jgi:outer membrane protein assembly factor BamD (BamD/ComL family)
VDGAREAYQRGNAGSALARLDGYERVFPQQRLLPEVLYLRMQSFRQRGETQRAQELAGRLVRDFPNNPHASSARALLQGSIKR